MADGSGSLQPAQADPSGTRVYYPTALQPGQRRRFRLVQAEADAEPTLRRSVRPGLIEVEAPGLGLRLAWGPDGPAGPDLHARRSALASHTAAPPLLGVRGVDGLWFGGSSWQDCDLRLATCAIREAGPVRLVLLQRYERPARRDAAAPAVELEYEIDCVGQVVLLRVRQSGELPGALVWHLGRGYHPTQAYWRPHSPAPWHGPASTDEHHRQVYRVRYGSQADELRLGPFYNWEKDAASFWTGWGRGARRDLLYLACVRPSMTATDGRCQPLVLAAGGERGARRLDLRFPLQQGRRAFALALLDRDRTSVATTGPPNHLDQLHCRLNGPGLADYCQMVLDWPGMQRRDYPRVWAAPADLPRVRKRFARWAWLRECFAAHATDRVLDTHGSPDLRLTVGTRILGQDPAGAYLATGDQAWAQQARKALLEELAALSGRLADYGPSVDPNLGIGLARPWRALILNLDLVLGSAAFTAAQRRRVLQQLAFVAEVSCTDDAWPATGCGIHRGNENFHADVVSARGLAAALLDGHPRQAAWLEAAATDMSAFLHGYHLASGVSRESATYQLCVLAYGLQLEVALRRRPAAEGRTRRGLIDDRCKAAFDFLAAQQTPPDPRCGYSLLPTLGHVTAYAWCQSLQACFGWAAAATADTDPSFSARMMAAWHRGGRCVIALHDYHQGRIWSPPLCLLDPALPAAAPDGRGSRAFDGFGAVLRAAHAEGSEGYVAVKIGECTGHFDDDEGSFVWYAFGQPLLADFGCQYNPNLHSHPWLHNRISIDHRADGPPRGGRLLQLRADRGLDYLCGELWVRSLYRETEWPSRERDFDHRQAAQPPRPVTPHCWRRHLLYLHDLEVIALLDEVAGDLPTDWSLQVLADAAEVNACRAECRGQFGVNLSVAVIEPAAPRLEVSAYAHLGFDEPRLPMWWWRSAAWTAAPGTTMTAMAERALTLRAHAEPGQGYFAVLAAWPDQEAAPEWKVLEDGTVSLRGHRGNCRLRVSRDLRNWQVRIESPKRRATVDIPLPPSGSAAEPPWQAAPRAADPRRHGVRYPFRSPGV